MSRVNAANIFVVKKLFIFLKWLLLSSLRVILTKYKLLAVQTPVI